MATIKSFTDLEQSKKLAEFLPIESADMHYVLIDTDENKYATGLGKYIGILPHHPAWSLAALLGVLPNGIVMFKDSQNGKYHSSSMYIGTYVTADNSIDACVAMIEKLNELKML